MRSHFLLPLLCLTALSGCQGPISWWHSVSTKVRHIRELEANYTALKKQHDRLQRDYYRLEADFTELKSGVESREAGERNLRATGSLSGRSPASIAYTVPSGLRPEELLGLGYEHFGERRFGEAAVTFEALLKQPEAAVVADASVLYTAGVAWFELGNYHRAKERFEEARNSATGDQRQKVQKKVDLWMRVIYQKLAGEKGARHGG